MLYFAYGSNLSHRQMDERCPGHRPVRGHRLAGFRLVLRGVADIERDEAAYIEGALYEITDEHEATLSGHEGVPHVYDRRWFEAEDGPVLYYQMVSPDYRAPREGYVETIAAGYEDWGIPTDTLERAKREAGLTV
jgi:hypothetical protein